ncbi:hypothetical protein [Methanococcoides alaskense]|uniref:Uncharacterized protein n=1 Tax=Methanococcoides alaskense TaxID=325778 RepID=A0AA90TZY4_9EURY|nr:hypothetical protein [Methanococcoides alaskense]MDR6223383.1 hypothetical protein [Methanococcoides alaskense]
MNEDLGRILNKGFSTWSHNYGIAVPFFLNMVASLFILMMAIFLIPFIVAATSMSDIGGASSLTTEESIELLMSLFSDNIVLVLVLGLIAFLAISFVQSYFEAGAIGMAQAASASGHTTFDDMFRAGKENVFSLFFTRIIISLIFIAGIVFIVPGMLTMGDFKSFIDNPENALLTSLLLLFGFLLWGLYVLVIDIIFSVVRFGLVLDRLDPMEALVKGYSFFMNNKLVIFLMYLVVIGISIAINMVGELISYVEVLANAWIFLSFILSFAVIQPLVTVWWTRLYMNRTGKELYDISELLEYP